MTQRSVPHNGTKPQDIDAGAYTSGNVLMERQSTLLNGVKSSITKGLHAALTLDNDNKIATIVVDSGHAIVDGTTFYSNSDVTFEVPWSSISLSSPTVTFQLAICVNRTVEIVSHIDIERTRQFLVPIDTTDYVLVDGVYGVGERTARMVVIPIGREEGLLTPFNTHSYTPVRSSGGVFIQILRALTCTADGNNVLFTVDGSTHNSKADWSFYNGIADNDVINSEPNSFELQSFSKLKIDGVVGASTLGGKTSDSSGSRMALLFGNCGANFSANIRMEGIDLTDSKYDYGDGNWEQYIPLAPVGVSLSSIGTYTKCVYEVHVERFFNYGILHITSTFIGIPTGTLTGTVSEVFVGHGVIYFDSDNPTLTSFGTTLTTCVGSKYSLEVS